jgi:uncharacterized protein involved in propanediol utilization
MQAGSVQLVVARREARNLSTAAQHAQSVVALARERIAVQKQDAATLKEAAATIGSAVEYKTLARQQWAEMLRLQHEAAPKRLETVVAGRNLEHLQKAV